jgi:hypothetical protein
MTKETVIVNELDNELIDALNEKEQEGIKLLNIKENETPKQTVKKIMEMVDDILSKTFSKDELQEYALQLGTIWGKMVEKEYGWSWKDLDFGDEVQGIYLVSPKSYYCCPPLYFLTKILNGNNKGFDGENDNTVLLLFNMMDGIEKQRPSKNYQVIT